MKDSIYPDWLRGFGERVEYKLTGREWREFAKIADYIESIESEREALRVRLGMSETLGEAVQRAEQARTALNTAIERASSEVS